MKLKLREADEYLNYSLKDKDWKVFCGYDSAGSEVYTGDIVVDAEGAEYEVDFALEINLIPLSKNLSKYKLKN